MSWIILLQWSRTAFGARAIPGWLSKMRPPSTGWCRDFLRPSRVFSKLKALLWAYCDRVTMVEMTIRQALACFVVLGPNQVHYPFDFVWKGIQVPLSSFGRQILVVVLEGRCHILILFTWCLWCRKEANSNVILSENRVHWLYHGVLTGRGRSHTLSLCHEHRRARKLRRTLTIQGMKCFSYMLTMHPLDRDVSDPTIYVHIWQAYTRPRTHISLNVSLGSWLFGQI